MIKKIVVLLILMLPVIFGADAEEEVHALSFLEGTFRVVGSSSESWAPYGGTVRMSLEGNKLMVVRDIKGRPSKGTGELRKTRVGAGTEFVVHFVEGKTSFEAVYLIQNDYDNYPRLTGYVYRANGETRKMGYEALFPDYGQLICE